MKIKLPIQQKEIVETEKELELKIHKSEKEFDLDMSINAQSRFEKNFPEMAKHEDIFQYSKRISTIEETNAVILMSKMKMLYCWFDTDMTYNEFLSIFDLTDFEYIKSLTTKMNNVFNLILNSSSEKN